MRWSMARLRIKPKWTPYGYGEERGASASAQGKDAKATDIRYIIIASTPLSLVILLPCHHCRPNPEYADNAGLIRCHKYLVLRRFSHNKKLMVACPPHVLTYIRHPAKPTHSLFSHSQSPAWTQKARRRARHGDEARHSSSRSSTKNVSASGEPVQGECLPTSPKSLTPSHHMATTTKTPTPCRQALTGRWTTFALTKVSKTTKRRV